jgi:polyhydroxyalkanoate synthase
LIQINADCLSEADHGTGKRRRGHDMGHRPSSAPGSASGADHAFRAAIAGATGGLSPTAMADAWADWAIHLAASPGKRAELFMSGYLKAWRLALYAAAGGQCEPCVRALPQDRRFEAEAWREQPFGLIAQSFLSVQQWWDEATTGVHGVSAQDARMVEFGARQILDTVSPSNFLATNPEALRALLDEGGANLVRGWMNALEDLGRALRHEPPPGAERYRPGETVAVTPGKVVYRNHLIELIQYAPATDQVRAEPVVIVPAWIMKYYILDLSPENSLVRWLVGKGHTVFMISWRNPGPEDRDLGMEDYRRLGPAAAIDAACAITGARGAHAVGYCLGGTLLTAHAALMAREDDDRLRSMTLLAAQMDFTEAGELTLFTTESQVAFLESLMWAQGYLDSRQMAGAFTMLRSSDLLWSRMERDYLMGERREANDLMAWNADGTRLPYRMHSEYLRQLFLENRLAAGRFVAAGQTIELSDIRVPVFAVATERDHVAPWRSVYKTHLLLPRSDVTFLLTSGGHNAGIVSEPDRTDRRYRVSLSRANATHPDPEDWLESTAVRPGSWWPEWLAWLGRRSGALTTPAPIVMLGDDFRPIPGTEPEDAPGRYVLMD